ncbi:MAG: HdeD family acid-resistance protein [Actinomycetota bacterium]|nr:HdeD family acid-resistance protein [Actinomycetota bacterium]
MPIQLVGDWRMIAVRGVISIAFGVLALVWPGLTVTALVLLFGAFVLVDGVASLALAVSFPVEARHRRKALLLEGVAGVLVGAITFAWPGITGLALLWIIALWALVTGALEIAAAIRLRRALRGDWFLALVGVLSVLFGAFLLITPGEGALVITWVIGWYAVLFGVLLLVFAGRVKTRGVARSRRRSQLDTA